MAAKDGFDFDPRAVERLFKGLEKTVLPTAQAGFLNGLAFGARKALIKHAEDTIRGGPTPFTKRAFVVDKAVDTASAMSSVVKIQPTQAQYLQYLINGGERRAGDPGASRYDVLVDGDEKNAFGNIRKGYLKRVAQLAKAEKTKRARLRARRDNARATGKDPSKFAWKPQGTSGNGVFFGQVGDAKGYWQRPGNRKGAPTMLVRFTDVARYRPTFLWDQTIAKHLKSADLEKMYAAEIERAIKKLKA